MGGIDVSETFLVLNDFYITKWGLFHLLIYKSNSGKRNLHVYCWPDAITKFTRPILLPLLTEMIAHTQL